MPQRSRSKPANRNSALPDAAWRAALRRRLLAWYRREARDLPWRRSRDVYHVWVSEIMLQQTQVATVVPYFQRFIDALPTIADLAESDEQHVLRHWEGLGYYRRARQLHAAAREIVARHNGQFPRDPQVAQRLPGIGRYTAGAILSIAFDQREPIFEANTRRLYARLLGYGGDPTRQEGQQLLWRFAAAILPRRNTGELNQALMELGSQLCLPSVPKCSACPLERLCHAAAAGLQHEIPPAKKKEPFEQIREAAVVVRRRGRLLLRRCGPDERWAGLWDFPRVAVERRTDRALRKEITQKVQRLTGVDIETGARLTVIKHGVTRYRITLECFLARHVLGPDRAFDGTQLKWLRPTELARYPLSTTGRKIAQLLLETSSLANGKGE